jgi:hypothetical protein
MSCTKCKQKETMQEKWKEASTGVSNSAIVVFLIMLGLSVFGLYELIRMIL